MVPGARELRRLFGCMALSAATLACGARTTLDVPSAGEPPHDAAGDTLDAGRARRDAGRRDAGSVDAGPPAIPCARDADCAEGVCALDETRSGEDLAPAPLACGGRPGAPLGARCDDLAGCARGLCVVAGTCVAACTDDDDCGAAEGCRDVYVRTGPTALQPLPGCVPEIAAPSDVEVSRERRAGALTGGLDDVRLDDAPGTTTWVLEPERGSAVVLSFATRDTPPVSLFDVEAFVPDGPAPRNPVMPFGDTLTVLVPNGPRARTTAAGYLLSLTSTRPSDVVVTRLTRVPPSPISARVFDVDVFYVGGGSLSPSGDRGPAEVAAALARVDVIYRGARTSVGEVRQHEVVGGLRSRFATLEADDEGFPELGELLRLTAGAAGPSLSLFLVRMLDMALGVSGGIPGAAGVPGTAASGVVVGVDLLGPSGIEFGVALAHEWGHFLGLFHTTEYDGSILDPLPDTPRCNASRDVDLDGYLLPEECAGAGADNVMFWSGSGDGLTADQAAVLRTSPALR